MISQNISFTYVGFWQLMVLYISKRRVFNLFINIVFVLLKSLLYSSRMTVVVVKFPCHAMPRSCNYILQKIIHTENS